jgi:hypothetical protein
MNSEKSAADVEALLLEQHKLYMLLFNLIIRHDEHLRLDVAEAIRMILISPAENPALSPVLRAQLQSLRDNLFVSTPPEFVSAFSRPSVRPVD